MTIGQEVINHLARKIWLNAHCDEHSQTLSNNTINAIVENYCLPFPKYKEWYLAQTDRQYFRMVSCAKRQANKL